MFLIIFPEIVKQKLKISVILIFSILNIVNSAFLWNLKWIL